MVQKPDADSGGGLRASLGCKGVACAWERASGRVIVYEDDRVGIADDGDTKNIPWVRYRLREPAHAHKVVGYGLVERI